VIHSKKRKAKQHTFTNINAHLAEISGGEHLRTAAAETVMASPNLCRWLKWLALVGFNVAAHECMLVLLGAT
jgi:hypothetical protein